MNDISNTLYSKVHEWIDGFGFCLNGSQTNTISQVTTSHYFFETFNFFESAKDNDATRAKFMCFDTYGETVKIKTLLDLQRAFFENISQLK